MARAYAFTVPGEPLAKARPRVTQHGTYTPKPTRQAEDRVAAAFLEAFGRTTPDTTHAWDLAVDFHRFERRARDLDNLVKLVMDGLNGLAWADDSQVEAFGQVRTFWVDHRADARTVVYLRPTNQPRPSRSKT